MQINPYLIVKDNGNLVNLLNTDSGQQYQLGREEFAVLASNDKTKKFSCDYKIHFCLEEQNRLVQIFIDNGLLVAEDSVDTIINVKWESVFKVKLCAFVLGNSFDRFVSRINNHVMKLIRKALIRISWFGPSLFVLYTYLQIKFGCGAREFAEQLLSIDINGYLYIYVLSIIVTFFHELSHAIQYRLSCDFNLKVGIMIFFLTPVAYCDLTGIYYVAKEKRIKILLAGCNSQMIINIIYLIVIFVVDFSTNSIHPVGYIFILINYVIVLFNLMPFVKYDGYWVLSNKWEITNLMEKSISILLGKNVNYRNKSRLYFFGITTIVVHVFGWIYTMLAIYFALNRIIPAIILNILILLLNCIFVVDIYTKYKRIKKCE